MTTDQVRQIPDFQTLQDDDRFRAMMAYVRANMPAEASSADGSWFRGRQSVIYQIESLFIVAPNDPSPIRAPRQQYKQPANPAPMSAT